MLSEAEVQYFKVFGYLQLKGVFSKSEIGEIAKASEAILAYERYGRPFDNEKRQSVYHVVENDPVLVHLFEDDRVYKPIEQLLGENFVSLGSETGLYVGDTSWHPDWHRNYPKIKTALYLEPVSKDSGCLRVIPGSHHREFHEPLHPGLIQKQLELQLTEVPSVALESEPGDVIIFNMRVFHSSYGGRAGRHMLAMNFSANPVAPEDIEAYKENIGWTKNEVVKQRIYKETNRLLVDSYLYSDKPRIKALTAKLFEYDLLSS